MEHSGIGYQRKREFFAEPGTRTGVPVVFTVPAAYSGTMLNIRAQINFGEGQESSDSFRIDVIPDTSVTISSKIGVFDPEGKTDCRFAQMEDSVP